MDTAVLDTDTLSAVMRQDPIVTSRAQTYLATHSRLTISIITRFEIVRGLNAKNATVQTTAFHAISMPAVLWPGSRVGLHPDEVTIADLLKTKGYATTFELYDLDADIRESNDVAHQHPEVVARMHEFAVQYDKELKANQRPPWREGR